MLSVAGDNAKSQVTSYFYEKHAYSVLFSCWLIIVTSTWFF